MEMGVKKKLNIYIYISNNQWKYANYDVFSAK